MKGKVCKNTSIFGDYLSREKSVNVIQSLGIVYERKSL